MYDPIKKTFIVSRLFEHGFLSQTKVLFLLDNLIYSVADKNWLYVMYRINKTKYDKYYQKNSGKQYVNIYIKNFYDYCTEVHVSSQKFH